MSRKKNNKKSIVIVILIALFCAIVSCGIKFYLDTTKSNISEPPIIEKADIDEGRPVMKVTVFLAKTTDTGTYLVPVEIDCDTTANPMDFAIKALFESKDSKEYFHVIPDDAKLINPITVNDNVAFVDLNKAFIDNFNGGSAMESLTINAIAHTVVENSDGSVEKVKILVEGKDVETLGGHLELLDPIEPDGVLLAPKKSE